MEPILIILKGQAVRWILDLLFKYSDRRDSIASHRPPLKSQKQQHNSPGNQRRKIDKSKALYSKTLLSPHLSFIRFLLPLYHSATAHILFFPIPFLHTPPYKNRDYSLAHQLRFCIAHMCHPNLPDFIPGDLTRHSRWRVLPATDMGPTVDADVLTREVVQEANDRGGAMKRCVCSPTRHAGSFRCRLHIAEYVWRRKCAH